MKIEFNIQVLRWFWSKIRKYKDSGINIIIGYFKCTFIYNQKTKHIIIIKIIRKPKNEKHTQLMADGKGMEINTQKNFFNVITNHSNKK